MFQNDFGFFFKTRKHLETLKKMINYQIIENKYLEEKRMRNLQN